MKKPFLNLMRYGIRRSRWNPLRYIFGEWTTTSNAKKAWKQVKFDVGDISITTEKRNPAVDYLIRKQVEKWWSENPQMSQKLKDAFEKHYD